MTAIDKPIDAKSRVLDLLDAYRDVEVAATDRARLALNIGAMDVQALRRIAMAFAASDPVRPSDLAGMLGISTASTTQLIDRLERVGLVERRPHPADRRSIVIEPVGDPDVDETRRAERLAVEDLDEDEADVLVRFFTRLTAALTLAPPVDPDAELEHDGAAGDPSGTVRPESIP